MKKKSKEVKALNVWHCITCEQKEESTHEQIMAHLREAHGLDTKGLKCTRSMLMHMDGDTWFSSEYEVTVQSDKGEVKLFNATMNPRAKDDMMRFV